MRIRGKISKIDLAYIAGLFDGEGHVFVHKTGLRNIRSKTPTFVLQVGITNTYRDVILWVYQLFPSTVHERIRHKNHPTWKPCFFWNTSAEKAKDFLKEIYPYLKIKKEQARLAIELQEKWQHHQKHRNGRFLRTPEKVIRKREWYKKQISCLNKKKSPAETKRANIS